jgi:hypothetical protein
MCAWIKPNAYPASSYMAIVNYGSGSTAGGRRGLFLFNDGSINYIDHDGYGAARHTEAHTVPLNTWTHLCATAVPAATAGEITSEIYVNGSKIGAATTLTWTTAAGGIDDW